MFPLVTPGESTGRMANRGRDKEERPVSQRDMQIQRLGRVESRRCQGQLYLLYLSKKKSIVTVAEKKMKSLWANDLVTPNCRLPPEGSIFPC